MARALFASAKDALRFALNFSDDSIPGPVMNKEMASVPAAAVSGSTKILGEARAASKTAPMRSVALGGTQDRAGMAGWILQRFEQLDQWEKAVLRIRMINPRQPCSCGAACCRGWSVKKEWIHFILMLAEYVKEDAELLKAARPGVRGLSTDPKLRRALIEDYARDEERRKSVSELAEITGVSRITVAGHRNLIHEHLKGLEDKAWEDLAQLFDQVGITGDLNQVDQGD